MDWNAGRAGKPMILGRETSKFYTDTIIVVGDDESQILALVNQQPGVNDAH